MEPKEASEQNLALNPTVVKLGLVSFFADVASEMLYPITPIFLTTVLGASMASVGIIEGIAESIASLMKTYSGSWSDRINKRKPFIISGYALGALAKPLIGISTSWMDVLFARGVDRTGKGLRSAPRDAMIADSVSADKRGAAFGWHRGMDTLGAAVGPLLAFVLISLNPDDLRPLFFWALIPGAISVSIIFSIREKAHPAHATTWKNPFSAWKDMNIDYRRYVYAWAAFSVANSSDVFLLMKAKASGMSTQSVILLFCAYNVTYALSSPKLGQLSDRFDRRNVLISGLLVFAAVYVGFGVADQPWHYWALFLIYGVYMGATDGVGKAFAVDLSPKDLKGTGLGILGTVTGICTIAASSTAGILWDTVGKMWPFFFGMAGALVAAAMLLMVPSNMSLRAKS
jgi:MFS family permease